MCTHTHTHCIANIQWTKFQIYALWYYNHIKEFTSKELSVVSRLLITNITCRGVTKKVGSLASLRGVGRHIEI